MAIEHFEYHPGRPSKEHNRGFGQEERGTPRAKRARERPYVSRREMWILAGVLLVAAGWMSFQLLLTLVTLD